MIRLSPAATREIQRLMSNSPATASCRLQIQPGGCADWLYILDIDDTTTPDDYITQQDGIQLAIDPGSLAYVNDLVLDYSEDLMGGGFRFHNSKATKSCSCGNSFSVEAS